MNIAFTTVLLFVFLLPGMTLRRFYFTEEFSKEYFKQNFFELFISSFIPSAIIQFLWINLVALFGYAVDIEVVGALILSKDFPQEAVRNVSENISQIAAYHGGILAVSALVGYFAKKVFRQYRLDSKYKLLRFKNVWHYLLTGDFFQFDRAAFDLEEDSPDNIDFVHIDVLVDTAEGTLIYDGFFVDYELSDDGGLDTLTLKNVGRRRLSDDSIRMKEKLGESVKEGSSTYYEIPGHILIIPYKSVINLNLTYYKFISVEGENGELGISIRPVE